MALTAREKYLRKFRNEPVYYDLRRGYLDFLGQQGWAYCACFGAVLGIVYSRAVDALPYKNSEEGQCNRCLHKTGRLRAGGTKHRVPMLGFWLVEDFPYIKGEVLKSWGPDTTHQSVTSKGETITPVLQLAYEEGIAVRKALKGIICRGKKVMKADPDKFFKDIQTVVAHASLPHQAFTDPYERTYEEITKERLFCSVPT
jgi:hypothetical protein